MQGYSHETLHYLTEEFDIKYFVIEVDFLKVSPAGEFIANFLKETMPIYASRIILKLTGLSRLSFIVTII